MFEIQGSLISGCMLGIELVSGKDLDDPEVSWGLAVDILIIRLVFVVLK